MTTTPTIPPKPAAQAEEIAIPQHDVSGFNFPGFAEWQKAEHQARELRANYMQGLVDKRRDIEQNRDRELREIDDKLRAAAGSKPSKPRRASIPREELQRRILEALKGSEASGNTIAQMIGVDPNRVTSTLEEMVRAKTVAHNGKDKKASRFYLPK